MVFYMLLNVPSRHYVLLYDAKYLLLNRHRPTYILYLQLCIQNTHTILYSSCQATCLPAGRDDEAVQAKSIANYTKNARIYWSLYMKIINKNAQNAVSETVRILQQGGLVIFPTDTAYGLGADITNSIAIDRVFELKDRSEKNPLSIIVSDMNMAGEYGTFSSQAHMLAETFLPGPLTIVVPKTNKISERIVAGGSTIGIRIPDCNFILEVVRQLGKPITATSANRSGKGTPYMMEEALHGFNGEGKYIDLVIDGGSLGQLTSTVVDISTSEPVIVREGPISREDILKVLG